MLETGFLALCSRPAVLVSLGLLTCLTLAGPVLAQPVAPKATASPTVKVLPWEHVGILYLRRPSQFHRIEDGRERMLWECDAKDGWCQLALGQKDLGQKAEFAKEDCKKLAQTLFPYIQKAKGTKWRQVKWMGGQAYRVEFSGSSATVRLYSAQTFMVRGGLLLWTGVVCPESQKPRWLPAFEGWIKTAKIVD